MQKSIKMTPQHRIHRFSFPGPYQKGSFKNVAENYPKFRKSETQAWYLRLFPVTCFRQGTSNFKLRECVDILSFLQKLHVYCIFNINAQNVTFKM